MLVYTVRMDDRTQHLLDFVRERKERGQSEEDIIDALVKSGWSRPDAERRLRHVHRPAATPPDTKASHKSSETVLGVGFVVVIAALIGGTIFAFISGSQPDTDNSVANTVSDQAVQETNATTGTNATTQPLVDPVNMPTNDAMSFIDTAAEVDSLSISWQAYQQDLTTLDYFYEQVSEEENALPQPAASYNEKTVLSRLIREAYLEKKAEELGVSVSDEDVAEAYALQEQQAATETDLESTIQDLYGWTPEQYRSKVLRPALLRQAVQEYLMETEELFAAARTEAEGVLAEVRANPDAFDTLAQTHSDDITTASQGGDLGFFARGMMVGEFEDAAFSLRAGEVSELVKTVYGFHIIKVLEVQTAEDGSTSEVRAAHILIQAQTLEDWLTENLKNALVTVYVGGYEWNPDCGLVLGAEETCDDNEILNSMTGL